MRASRDVARLAPTIATATDEQIVRIVAVVDGLAKRGDADALIAPLRARLAALHPPRPVSFTRLLFTPINRLIVPPQLWRSGSLSVPRTALLPIAEAVRAVLPDAAAQVDAEGREGGITPARLTVLSAALWPAAAAALDTLRPSASWGAVTGLPEDDYTAIATAIAAPLAVAVETQALMRQGGVPPEAMIRTILGRTAPRGPNALSAVVVVLLAALTGPERILALGQEAAGSNPSRAIDHAVEHTLDTLQRAFDTGSGLGQDLDRAAADTAHMAALLQASQAGASTRPDRKRRIDRLRRTADTMVQARFADLLKSEILDGLANLPLAPDDATVEALENAARGLRRLEEQGRLLGSSARYEDLRAAALQPLQTSALRPPDRVRLIEILLSTDEARRLVTAS